MIKIQLNYDLERGQYYKGRIYVGGDSLEVSPEDLKSFEGLYELPNSPRVNPVPVIEVPEVPEIPEVPEVQEEPIVVEKAETPPIQEDPAYTTRKKSGRK